MKADRPVVRVPCCEGESAAWFSACDLAGTQNRHGFEWVLGEIALLRQVPIESLQQNATVLYRLKAVITQACRETMGYLVDLNGQILSDPIPRGVGVSHNTCLQRGPLRNIRWSRGHVLPFAGDTLVNEGSDVVIVVGAKVQVSIDTERARDGSIIEAQEHDLILTSFN
jgi:hypothetical protein